MGTNLIRQEREVSSSPLRPDMTDQLSNRKYLLLISLCIFLLDRFTKWLVAKDIPLHDSHRIISGFFYLTHVENPGAAFSLFADSPSAWKIAMLVMFSIVALVIVAALLWRSSHALLTTGEGLALILGGAVGNLWDRLVSGRVVDFLLFYLGSYQWPAFNVADSAIVAGAGLLAIEILFAKSPKEIKPV
jgi:signal peptidase II